MEVSFFINFLKTKPYHSHVSRIRTKPFLYPQLSQFFRLQVEQADPSEDEETNFPPQENPKVEKSLLTFSVPHFGQATFSPLVFLWRISNFRLHSSHRYS